GQHVWICGTNTRASLEERREYDPQVAVVCDLYRHHGHPVVFRIVDHRLHVAVANDVHAAIGVANLGDAKFNRFDDAPGAGGFDEITHEIDVLEQDEEAGHNVVDQRLCAEADDQAQDAGPGEERHRVETQSAQHQRRGREIHPVREDAANEWHNRGP